MRIGTAGWSISRDAASAFPGEGRHLERYARCARLRRDQFLVPPQPPRRGLPALGRADAAWLSLFGQAAARHQPRRASASCTRAAAAIPGRSRRPGRSAGAAAGAAAAVVRVRGARRRGASSPCSATCSQALSSASRAIRAGSRRRRTVRSSPVASAASPPIRRAVRKRSDPGGWLGSDGDGRGAVVYYRWHGSPRMYWSRYDLAWLQRSRRRAEALAAGRRLLVHLRQHGRRRRDLERARASHAARQRTPSLAVVALPVFLHREHALRADRAPRREERGRPFPPRRPPRRAPPGAATGSSSSIVQWKLCGLTTLTRTTLTAMPSARPSAGADAGPDRAFGGDDGEDLAPRQAEVGEQAELLAPRQHLRREARGDAEQADRDRHRLQPVGDGEAAVEDAQRRRADLARRRELEQASRRSRARAASRRSSASTCARCSRRARARGRGR